MTERAPYDPENIFAKIIRGDMPATKIAENDDMLAFMDIFPQSRGHCLVIPKTAPATSIFDIDAEALSALIGHVQRIAKAVDAALNPDGVRIAQFNGAPAGQTVFHIHFHIIPTYADEPIGAHAGGEPADPQALEMIAAQIAEHL
ncbi:MAG: HIT family protein [Pseudomonadota bacterium]